MEEKSLKKGISLVKRLPTYNIVLPEVVEEKIRFLCSKVWDTEWSGVLFYKPSGKFEDGSLEIKCVDIFPMDIGSTTYTEFDMSPDVISYMTDNDLLDCQMGLIHSHNNMATFFSGTDLTTLKEEGLDRNHFVSLIVNNAGSYTAAITRKITYIENRTLGYKTFEGKKCNDITETSEEKEELEYFYLNIVFEKKPINDFSSVASRLDEIKKYKAEKAVKESNTINTASIPTKYSSFLNNKTTIEEPTLFSKKDFPLSEEEEELRDYNRSFGVEYTEDYTYKPYVSNLTAKKVTKKLIDDLTCQLITGSITMCYNEKFNTSDWVKNKMPALFERRFGRDKSGMTNCQEWAIDFIEYICNCTIATKDHDEDEICYLIASGITKNLKALPKSPYIDLFIELLRTYAEFI